MFETLLGNTAAKAYLTQTVSAQSVPHALLFEGPQGVGKSLFAKHLAAALLNAPLERVLKGMHPDFYVLRPEGKSALHSIESIRELISQVQSAPFESAAQVFLIESAEQMQPAAANALLKTLEEPTPHTTLILLSSAPKDLLPTVVSRSVQVHFQPLSEVEKASLKEQTLDLSPLFQILEGECFSQWDQIEKLVENEDPLQEHHNVELVFKTVLMWMRDQYARRAGVEEKVLFFPERPAVGRGDLPSFEKFNQRWNAAYLAYQRNIKLSACLKHLFSF